jgi:predicted porin
MWNPRLKPIARALFVATTAAAALQAGPARADDATQREIEALKAQIQALSHKVDELSRREAARPPPIEAAPAAQAPGQDLTYRVGAGMVQIYGHVDVSLDTQTNGMSDFMHNGQTVTGRNGWVPDISSNLSYFGVRGNRTLDRDLKGVFQFETEVSYAATPGASDQAPDGTAQKYSLGSRDSFVGLQSASLGAIKLGKSDTPYKRATSRMDPFSSTPGDYNAIMGNSGGDNRAEFDARLPHSIWYESPNMGPLSFAMLFSPGQNRSTDTGLYAQGEPDCAGGNSTAGLNGDNGQPLSCEDGSFNNAFSAALTYHAGPLYAIAGYELHKSVNRKGDEIDPGTIGVRDESAYKLGVQYTFPTHTTVNVIVERLKRDAITAALNERTHTATWLAVTQKFSALDELNIGWAHADATPGQPDQSIQDRFGNDNGPGPSDNKANLYAFGHKHRFADNKTAVYLVYARLKNDYWAHYSLGAGGHGLPTRNYVGDKFIGGCQDGGVCGPPFAGNTPEAFSLGLIYDF